MNCEECGLMGFKEKDIEDGKCPKCKLKEWEKRGGHI